MKIILNQDVKHLGEEGDIKDVANGYARNYLFPRNLAVPCNDMTVAYFENKKADIEARKADKRASAAGLKERLESAVVALIMPAGANGKLYGAVTNQTIADELLKQGFEVERKKIEVPGLTIKNVGKYSVTVRLYESATASVSVTVQAQPEQTSSNPTRERPNRRRYEEERTSAAHTIDASSSEETDPVPQD